MGVAEPLESVPTSAIWSFAVAPDGAGIFAVDNDSGDLGAIDLGRGLDLGTVAHIGDRPEAVLIGPGP